MKTEQSEWNDELTDLPPPPTLRRQNAISCPEDLKQRFLDTRTNELVFGNPDLTHISNRNLVKLGSFNWAPGKCKPKTMAFFKNQDNKHDDNNMPISLVIGA